jgi:predicted permease
MTTILRDLRYALRALRRAPTFAAVAIGSLALGLGANTVAFTLYNALFLQPLPVPEPERLVRVYGVGPRGERQPLFSYADYRDYRDRARGVVDLVGLNKALVTVGDAPPASAMYDDFSLPAGYRYAYGSIVSGNFFAALGAPVALGRALTPDDDVLGRDPVVVLGDGFWRRRLAADRGVVGRTIVLQGTAFTVVGVAAPSFTGTDGDIADFWVPLSARDAVVKGWAERTWSADRGAAVLGMLGRLRPGVTSERARAVLDGVARQLAAADPREGRAATTALEGAGTRVPRNAQTAPAADTFLAAVWLVLLVACANVTSLLVARAAERQREIGVRLAIGAGRARLVRQLVAESVLLCLAGGAAALLLADLAIRVGYPIALDALAMPPDLLATVQVDLSPDLRVLAYTFALATAAGVLLGLLPALQASRPDLTAVIKQQGSLFGARLRTARVREALVVGQVVLSLVLLVSAGLLVRNLRAEQGVSLGFAPRGVYAVAVGTRADSGGEAGSDAAARAAVLRRLAELPGVAAVSAAAKPPLSGNLPKTTVSVPGTRAAVTYPGVAYNRVAPDYFATMALRVVRGRTFEAPEAAGRANVALVSASTARHFWPGEDPIGRRLALGASGDSAARMVEVVGVVSDARSAMVWRPDRDLLYLPAPADAPGMVLLARTAAAPAAPRPAVADSLRAQIEGAAPGVVATVRPLDGTVEFQLAPFRGLALAASALGVLALVLAAAGLYGVIAYTVVRRLRDLALHVVLGASPKEVLRVALARGAWLVALGLAGGATAALGASYALRAVLVDVSAVDPVAFAGAAALVALVAVVAAVVPARRAVRVDPAALLREE